MNQLWYAQWSVLLVIVLRPDVDEGKEIVS